MKITNFISLTSIYTIICLMACSCGNKAGQSTSTQSYQKVSPEFDADSAYTFIDKQVSFGPRVPNTPQHVACGDYLVSKLKQYGAEVAEQKMVVTAYNGTKLNARNIIGSYGTDKKKRVLLFAHWDTRPYADHDSNPDNYKTSIVGANDGGSGIGVLLEVARTLQTQQPNIGVDIIFFDAEDYGTPDFIDNAPDGEWWCLGSQYWAKNPHTPNYKANYGILLDMVGAADATFYREYYSQRYAASIFEKVWSTARQLGYGKYFISKDGGGVTDDHVPVNQTINIPSIDIIDYKMDAAHGFFPQWHTTKDDMSIIDRNTLKAVGQTILEVLHKEKP